MRTGFLTKLKKSNGIKFFIYPIVFFILSCIMLIIALGPMIGPVWDILDLVTLSAPPSFSVNDQAPALNTEVKDHLDTVVVPYEGEQYARLVIESADIDAPVYYGDTPKLLNKGVGTYTGTYLPGQRRTILMAAHNNRHFRTIQQAKVGDKVEMTTTYGTYVYEITGTRIAKATDTTAYDLTKEEENLIMYTCYPFSRIGFKTDRYFVYAKYVSGPQIPEDSEEVA